MLVYIRGLIGHQYKEEVVLDVYNTIRVKGLNPSIFDLFLLAEEAKAN